MWLGVADLSAQRSPEGRGPGSHRGPGVEMILSARDRLGLTEDQVAELSDLREQMVALRTTHRTAMEQMRSSGDQMRGAVRERVEAILSEDQMVRLDQIRQARPRRGGGDAAHGRHGPRWREPGSRGVGGRGLGGPRGDSGHVERCGPGGPGPVS